MRHPRASLLRFAGLLLAVLLWAEGASAHSLFSSQSPSVQALPAAMVKQICAQNSHEVLLRTWRGIFPGRSGDIQLIPTYPDFMGAGLPHATPYNYTQQVPLFLYGPGFVKPGLYKRQTYLTDIAPTEASLLKFPFNAPDGMAQTQALLPADARPLPRLIVTLVWDSGGTDVLDAWKKDWPYLRSLMPKGAWFTRTTVGASPSNTPTGHAEIGTGAFPAENGFTDDYIRLNGQIQKPNANGPAFLVEPTLADLYDLAMGNKPIVAGIATLSAHIMMMSHGSEWSGGDKDIAITREVTNAATAGAESTTWNLSPGMVPFYRLPAYANHLPPLSHYVPALDAADGRIDGMWRSNSIAQLLNGFDTPARTPYQTKLIEAVIKREHIGHDATPDLLYLNYKAIDVVGHIFSANSIEMSDTLKVQDEALKALVTFLNAQVGQGNWVMALTADHGTQRSLDVSKAFLIDLDQFTADINHQFDHDGNQTPLIQRVRPTQLWVDPGELESNHITLTDISNFIMSLTEAQTIRAGKPVDPTTANDKVFAAALPSNTFSQLPCLPEARGTST